MLFARILRRPRNPEFPLSHLSTSLAATPSLSVESENRTFDLDLVVSQVPVRKGCEEISQALIENESLRDVEVSHDAVDRLLTKFRDDWKSALGIFRWAELMGRRFEHSEEAYDMIVDILGRTRQWDRMRMILDEMRSKERVRVSTVGKVMRRLSGAGRWEDAVSIFDELQDFGLEKNAEMMNLLLDTLCKEGWVEQARSVVLELKPHIPPDEHTFNILINGWCKIDRIDEAKWTIEEMKGYGFRPSVISFSTIIRFYCRHGRFQKVVDLLDEMEKTGCPPNIVTYTTVMHALAKADEYEDALALVERVKASRCEPDALFFNSWIYVLGRAGRVEDAVRVFELEMPNSGVLPNLSTYNTMTSMYCHHGEVLKASALLEHMEISGGCKPVVQTYYPLLKACFKMGKTDVLLSELLDEMVNKHHLSLDLSTYSLLIHGLCRANKCDRAFVLFEEMIGKDIIPRYQTCCLLLDELKQKCLFYAADQVEDVMKRL
ncbi:hypothetical protein MLD38_025467 [Melastoma candidum]|uniref:Uncharacterized protein n=1 Tax=Melastoma candidum TaxID=119954 RepID=A0ACB9P2E1_9MYRT|nr:hypothetical protein MLD38_025467 [Melastoma candidum]